MSSRRPVLVLGDGGWGTALAMVLHANAQEVRVWSHDPAYAGVIESTRSNPKFLPGVLIPAAIRFVAGAAGLAGAADLVFCVVPTQFLRPVLTFVRGHLPADATLVSCSKGFERETLLRPSQIISECVPGRPVVVLSGPSHAEEVSRGLPTAVVAAAAAGEGAVRVQQLLGNPRFRIYSSRDPVGVEVGGAAKNVIALAAGISDGLGFGDNARAGLISRGLRELARLGVALGANAETFSGLSGLGDLIATCTSLHSRNRAVGFRIGQGEALEAILRSTEKVAEGIETTRSIQALGRRLDVELPITAEVHAMLFLGKPPRDAVEALLGRETKEEIS